VSLTACAECGRDFAEPITKERALQDFPTLDVAAYNCAECEVGITDEFSVPVAEEKPE
jgi:hypothetical protein